MTKKRITSTNLRYIDPKYLNRQGLDLQKNQLVEALAKRDKTLERLMQKEKNKNRGRL